MKLVPDLVVHRCELQDWKGNLSWARDGCLYLTTRSEASVVRPVFTRDNTHFFHVESYPLDLDDNNKLEFETPGKNSLLNSQPRSYARAIRPCPTGNMLAVLTNNGNVILFEEGLLVANLDHATDKLSGRIYHSFAWHPQGNHMIVGNEEGELILFERFGQKFTMASVVKLKESTNHNWVTYLFWEEHNEQLLIGLSDNSAYCTNLTNLTKGILPFEIRGPTGSKITDMRAVGDIVFITSFISIQSYNIADYTTASIVVPGLTNAQIVPLVESEQMVLAVSDKKCVKLHILPDKIINMDDDIVTPHLAVKLKKWIQANENCNDYITKPRIYGSCVSPDSYSIAILYEFINESLNYRIPSQLQYRIMFVPLAEKWKISARASGLAWYETYRIYNKQLPENFRKSTLELQVFETNTDFTTYLEKFFEDEQMHLLQFSNFVKDKPSILEFQKYVYRYAVQHTDQLTNPLDMACIQSLAHILNLPTPVKISGPIEMKSEFINETFDFTENSDPETIKSKAGHEWKRCAVTLLPLLTSKLKICPVSGQRTIDIERDHHNDYGWLTRTLLEFSTEKSVYSGTKVVTK